MPIPAGSVRQKKALISGIMAFMVFIWFAMAFCSPPALSACGISLTLMYWDRAARIGIRTATMMTPILPPLCCTANIGESPMLRPRKLLKSSSLACVAWTTSVRPLLLMRALSAIICQSEVDARFITSMKVFVA